MKTLNAFVFAALIALIPSISHAGRETWEILEQVVPEGATSMSVSIPTGTVIAVTPSTSSILSWSTLTVSTAQVSNGGATLIMAASATRLTHIVTNEGPADIRIGPSTVTSTVGLLLKASSSLNLDGPGIVFRGAMYAFGVSSSSAAVSVAKGAP